MMLQLLSELAQDGPAGVRLDFVVRVPLDVQVLPAHGAEAGAVRPAEDLVRQPEDERVSRPGRQIEPVVRHVRRTQLVRAAGARRLVLARVDLFFDHRLRQAAEAGPVQAADEPQPEDRARARARDRELGGDAFRNWDVALAAEAERLEVDLLLARELLARAQPDVAQVEDRHAAKVAGPRRLSSTARLRRSRRC